MQRRFFMSAMAAVAMPALGNVDNHWEAFSSPDSNLKPVMPPEHKLPLPSTTLYELPSISGYEDIVAWTLDDGQSEETVHAYLIAATQTGIRLTCFPNGMYSSWAKYRDLLQPLLDSGQIILGNHTFNHPDLTSLSDTNIRSELLHNEQHFLDLFGVDLKPYFRAPYGNLTPRVAAVAADIGYTVPVQWYGSLGDGAVISPASVWSNAKTWFKPQRIVIAHANQPAVTQVLGKIVHLIAKRGLRLMTLNDIFYRQ